MHVHSRYVRYCLMIMMSMVTIMMSNGDYDYRHIWFNLSSDNLRIWSSHITEMYVGGVRTRIQIPNDKLQTTLRLGKYQNFGVVGNNLHYPFETFVKLETFLTFKASAKRGSEVGSAGEFGICNLYCPLSPSTGSTALTTRSLRIITAFEKTPS